MCDKDYPGIHQTYQATKTWGKTFGLVSTVMTGKSLYDDWHNYQGVNCAKTMMIDTGVFIGGWMVTAGVAYVASFFAVPTVVIFRVTVLAGAMVSLGSESLKDKITRKDK